MQPQISSLKVINQILSFGEGVVKTSYSLKEIKYFFCFLITFELPIVQKTYFMKVKMCSWKSFSEQLKPMYLVKYNYTAYFVFSKTHGVLYVKETEVSNLCTLMRITWMLHCLFPFPLPLFHSCMQVWQYSQSSVHNA